MNGHTATIPNNERCALLASVAAGDTAGTTTGGGGDEKEAASAASVWPYPLQHHLSSEVIRRTSVLWTPSSSSSSSSTSSSISIGWNRTNPTSRNTTPKEIRSSFSIATPTTYTKDAQSEEQDGNDDEDEEESASARTHRPPQSVSSKIDMVTTTSVLNLVVATAGGIGMVTLPGSFSQTGYMAGGLLLLLSSLAASMSLVLLNYACTMVRFLQHQQHDAPPEEESTEDGNTNTNNSAGTISAVSSSSNCNERRSNTPMDTTTRTSSSTQASTTTNGFVGCWQSTNLRPGCVPGLPEEDLIVITAEHIAFPNVGGGSDSGGGKSCGNVGPYTIYEHKIFQQRHDTTITYELKPVGRQHAAAVVEQPPQQQLKVTFAGGEYGSPYPVLYRRIPSSSTTTLDDTIKTKNTNNELTIAELTTISKATRTTTPTTTTTSYASLVAFTLGYFGSQTLEALTLLYCFGQIIAYLGAISGQVAALVTLIVAMPEEVDEGAIPLTTWIITIVALGVLFPCALTPEAGAMRFAGLLGTICMVYIVFAVLLGDGLDAVIQGGGAFCSLDAATSNTDEAKDEPMAFASSWITILKNAPIFLFAMNASVTYVPVQYQHQTCIGQVLASFLPTVTPATTIAQTSILHRESYRIITTAVPAAGLFYLVCSGVAYFAYCGNVPENVVDVWPLTWIPGVLARGFLIIELVRVLNNNNISILGKPITM